MDAVLLIDGHLVFLEVEIGDALLKDANEEVVGKLILVGKTGGGDGLKAREEGTVGLIAAGDGGERIVGELIVITVISKSGGALRETAKFSFVVFVKEGVLRGESIGERFGPLSERRMDDSEQEDECD
jgi:hypothetical protein